MPGKARDVFPNYLSLNLTQPAANALVTSQVFMPIPRIPMGKSATIMELLWMDLNVATNTLLGDMDKWYMSVSTGGEPAAVISIADGNCVLAMSQEKQFTISGADITTFPLRYNMQSQDGHGYLLASDSLWFALDSVSLNTGTHMNIRLHYRFVQVTIEEYIGIVQSQQSS